MGRRHLTSQPWVWQVRCFFSYKHALRGIIRRWRLIRGVILKLLKIEDKLYIKISDAAKEAQYPMCLIAALCTQKYMVQRSFEIPNAKKEDRF